MNLPTIFTILFALACLSTFACGYQKHWKNARIVSAVVAVMSFILALVSASMSAPK